VWLAGVLAVIVLVTLFIARIAGAGSDGDAPDGGSAQPGSSQSSSESATPEPSVSPESDGPAGPEAAVDDKVAAPAAMTLATAFGKAFATPPPASAPDQWWAGVSRHTDQTLAEQLRDVDPTTLKATKVTGPARSSQGGVSSAEVIVPTDAGELLVVCVLVDGEWKVADYELERRPT
jgi:hypothetical protein